MDAVPKPATIHDVAREARLGVGTVSRVLNSSPHVSKEARQRVQAAIRKLSFRPHAQARRIMRRRSEMVCFLLSNRDFLHPFHALILQGVETYARAIGQHVLFAALHYSQQSPASGLALPPVLRERGLIDGVILAGTTYPNLIQQIESLGVPFVAFSNNVVGLDGQKHFDEVGFDDLSGMQEATRYLVSQGHQRIVFAGDVAYPWIGRRYAGYRQAMRDARLRPGLIASAGSLSFMEFGQGIASRVLARRPKPTAIVAGNDEIAFGLWRTLRRREVRIPDEFSLVGFDDREEALLMDPPLTTVRVRKAEIGETCMKMLIERLHHPQMAFSRRILPTDLVVRETVRAL